MKHRPKARTVAIGLAALFFGLGSTGAGAARQAAAQQSPEEIPTFERDVWPILKAHCLDCHGAGVSAEGKLDLRQKRLMERGGESGPAIVAGSPDQSYLLARVEKDEMPPGEKKVSAAEKQTLRRWLAAGAPTLRPETAPPGPGIGITPEERQHWAFQQIRRLPAPAVQQSERVRTAIDAFVAQKLEENGLRFSEDADRRTLLRRAFLDLTGLPPTPEETAEFLADEKPDAYERLLARLLASSRYGERWARHWLDVAGYADSEGGALADAVRSEAFRYRDYVIASFNADKPFDQFIHEQLAGDELAGPHSGDLTARQKELLAATGFLRMAADGTGSGGDSPEAREKVMSDTLKIVSNAFLGLSVACAQCHDHRYDPVLQTDYYRLRAVFEPALNIAAWRPPDARRVSLFTELDRQKSAEIETAVQAIAAERAEKQAVYMKQALDKELEKYPEQERPTLRAACETPPDKRTPEQQQIFEKHPSLNITPGVLYQYLPDAAEDLKKYDARIEAERAKKPVEQFIRALVEAPGEAPATYLFYRGDYRQPKQQIGPGELLVVSPEGQPIDFPADDPALPTTGRRLAFARSLTSGRHPLAARVIANRVWMHHFGKGLSATPAEFGKLGDPPSHPELLDWLADEFARGGWSLKRLHATIMTSTVYRQSSKRQPDGEAIDSDNRLLWRAPARRLEAEALRDSMLHVAGSINTAMYGPPAEVTADDAGQPVTASDAGRRSIYIQVRRTLPAAVLSTFDAPDMLQSNCERREPSTVASQSLLLLNSQFALAQAARFAERVEREASRCSLEQLPPEVAAAPPIGFPWCYGTGAWDEASQRIAGFQPLPHFTGAAWQGGPNLPDANTNWAILHASGGHPGDRPDLAVVRRFTVPQAGKLSIGGVLAEATDAGNGVRGRIASNRQGLIGEWSVQNSQQETVAGPIEVAAGETIDFIVDACGDVTSDSFSWRVTLSLDGRQFSSEADFSGPAPPPAAVQVALAWELAYQRPIRGDELAMAIDFLESQLAVMQTDSRFAGQTSGQRLRQAMTNLCQSLLGSNEFLYID